MSHPSPPDPNLVQPEPSPPPLSYSALFLRFLKFGALAFGGPVAQIAMLRRELVEEEAWMSGQRFNRLLAVMQVLPGPEAHELCVHLGMRAKGRWGGVLAGLGFMLPGFVLMMILSWLYFRIDFDNAWIGAGFLGVQAAVVALILRAVHRIGQHILIDRWLSGVGLACAAATLAGVSFWITLPAAGIAYALAVSGRRGWALGIAALVVAVAVAARLSAPGPIARASLDFVVTSPGAVAPWILFLSGLKAGLLTFGGAYTAIPFLRNDATAQGWMGDGQFLDGLALSGVLPAPLIIFSTFVGYVAGGPLGALAITAGVFMPAFAFSLVFYDRLEAVVEMDGVKALLEGVAAGVVGLIAVTALQLVISLFTPLSQTAVLGTILAAAFTANWFWKSKLAPPVILAAAGLVGVLLLRV
ncbi:chromate transporter [Brevundimonas intermedia]|uniref:Chromate transporter n=1 Tax=Brevundimonas intermedia TaxID=74315 RepID=A0ABQ5T5J9_9CAUL|nr:chromate efflux transporter [Brevundimonas intermedia]GLK47641.1 chromate transporter [Brevundimonas intermedia]